VDPNSLTVYFSDFGFGTYNEDGPFGKRSASVIGRETYMSSPEEDQGGEYARRSDYFYLGAESINHQSAPALPLKQNLRLLASSDVFGELSVVKLSIFRTSILVI
jgi:hypothetical protein